ncbi:RidA family protein [Leptothoe sp. PORK10 BA2]|uniref:RidA family protein n=1 Tax=Leptothoe sp. PORK10 BA2 TaxID=3110254 RepID=UPI002B20D1AD|nr:RidA family protein [Leptothoe sp. PORK10 BA2]MEA5464703.1 RidA family protein [Leptothoe sp. PORK10 BA2]
MGTKREIIIPEGMEILYEKYRYCPGVKVGDTLYIAGQVGRDENMQVVEGTEAQFDQTFKNVEKVLSAAGATFDDVVEMITYHVVDPAVEDQQDLKIPHLPLFIQVKDRYFTKNFPTWTGVGIMALSTPGLIVEIKCTAVLGS